MGSKPFLVLVIILLVGIAPAYGEGYRVEKNGLRVTWYPVQEGISHFIYNISVENLGETERLVDLASVLSSTSFPLEKLRNLRFYRLVNVSYTEKIPIYDTMIYPCVAFNNETGRNESTTCLRVIEEGFKNVSDRRLEWRLLQPLAVDGGPEGHREEMGVTPLQAGEVSWFRLEFDAPVLETANGWGSSGQAALWIDGVEYHPWWNETWEYRRTVTVDNAMGEAELRDYQVALSLDTRSLIADGKMRGDCGDIRFTDESGMELPYWVEAGCNTSSTLVWVRVPVIPAGSNATVHLYYGNPRAKDAGNPGRVFEIFDDFSDGDYVKDPSWIVIRPAWAVDNFSLRDDQCKKCGAAILELPSNLSIGAWEWRTMVTGDGHYAMRWVRFIYLDEDNWYEIYHHEPQDDDNPQDTRRWRLRKSVNGTVTVLATFFHGDVDFDRYNWRSVRVTRDSNGAFRVYVDGVEKMTATDTSLTSSSRFRVIAQDHVGREQRKYFDDFRVRKFTSPEPVSVIGDEVGKPVAKPDLAVASGDIRVPSPLREGAFVRVNATIHNIGEVNASNVSVYFYEGDPGAGGVLIGEVRIPFVAPGGMETASAIWVAPCGVRDVYVIVDPLDIIFEASEENNAAFVTVNGSCRPSGVIFEKDEYYLAMMRDYDQRFTLLVKNNDDVAHNVSLTLDIPYDDLIGGFIGDGSPEHSVTLQPGESRGVILALHAQDANRTEYRIKAVATSDGLVNYANISVHVKQPVVNFSVEYVGEDSRTLVKTYRITNHGDPITDLRVYLGSELEGKVLVNPSITQGYLRPGESVEVQLVPIITEEGFTGGSPWYVEAAGVTKQVQATWTIPGNQSLYRIFLDFVNFIFRLRDYACINKPYFISYFTLPPGFTSEDVLKAEVRFRYLPGDFVERHNIRLYLNGHLLLGRDEVRDEDYYIFAVDPSFLNYEGRNTLLIEGSVGGGYYKVTRDVGVTVFVREGEFYAYAQSLGDAIESVLLLPFVHAKADELFVDIIYPASGFSHRKGTKVLVMATVKDGEGVPQKYASVTASFSNGDPSITLYDDGRHGDGWANDGTYANWWTANNTGDVTVTVIADNSKTAAFASVSGTILDNNPPSVTILSPSGGEVWNGTRTIAWSASDPDNDPLEYSVYYSVSSTGPWNLIAEGLTASSYDWDTTKVRNGYYYIRVVASDGALTGEAVSDVFRIEQTVVLADIASSLSG